MKAIVVLVLVALMAPAMGIDSMKTFGRDNLTPDPWMSQGPAASTKPVHEIDGTMKGVHIVAGSMGQLGQANLDAYEVQNGVSIDNKGNHILGAGVAPRNQWDNSLGGGIGLASPDPSLRTNDPELLAMGARPIIDQSSLPLFLQGGV